jgi:hypothetical protein
VGALAGACLLPPSSRQTGLTSCLLTRRGGTKPCKLRAVIINAVHLIRRTAVTAVGMEDLKASINFSQRPRGMVAATLQRVDGCCEWVPLFMQWHSVTDMEDEGDGEQNRNAWMLLLTAKSK